MAPAGFCARCRLLQSAQSPHCRACGARAVRRLLAAHTRSRARFLPRDPAPAILLGTFVAAAVASLIIEPGYLVTSEGVITVGCVAAAAGVVVAVNLVRQLPPLDALPAAAVTPSTEARLLVGTLRIIGPAARDYDGQPCAIAFLRISRAGGTMLRGVRGATFAVDTGTETVRVAGELWTADATWHPVEDSGAAAATLGLPDDLAGDASFEQLALRDGQRVRLTGQVADEMAAAEYRDAVGPVARGRAGAPVMLGSFESVL